MQTFRKRRAGLSATAGLSRYSSYSSCIRLGALAVSEQASAPCPRLQQQRCIDCGLDAAAVTGESSGELVEQFAAGREGVDAVCVRSSLCRNCIV